MRKLTGNPSSDLMKVFNADLAQRALNDENLTVKFILNNNAVAFFPMTQQHRETRFSGLRYEHDHRGNAVAGILSQAKVEIRFHSAYSDDRIGNLWKLVSAMSEFAGVEFGELSYQGRIITSPVNGNSGQTQLSVG